jgi:hypothetical protein
MCQTPWDSRLSRVGSTVVLLIAVACSDGSFRIERDSGGETFPVKLIRAAYCRVGSTDYVALTIQGRQPGWRRALRSVVSTNGLVEQLLLLKIPSTASSGTFQVPGEAAGYVFFLSEVGPSGGFAFSDGVVAVVAHGEALELSLEITPSIVGPETKHGIVGTDRERGRFSLQKLVVPNRPRIVLNALRSGVAIVEPALQDWKDRVERESASAVRSEQPHPSR